MANHVEVVLTQDVAHFGKLGEKKRVRTGYARNYLVPQNLALYVTPDNMIQFEAIKKRELKRRERLMSDMSALAEIINGKVLEFAMKTHDEGKLYGSVSGSDIVKKINEVCGTHVERKQVDLSDHIRALGEYTVPMLLHPELKVSITVKVTKQLELN